VLAGEDLCQLAASCVKKLPDAEEELGSFRQRSLAPARECGARGLDGDIHLPGRREVDRPTLPTGRRVVDGTAATGGALDPASADPVWDARRSRRVDGLGHAE